MKHKPHTITAEQLKEWFDSEESLFASAGYERKTLHCTLSGVFIVRTPMQTHYVGSNVNNAVNIYNSITDKYIEPTISFKL